MVVLNSMGACAQASLGQTDMVATWVILRCASSETLELVESLGKLGIEAWSPIGRRRGRKPRSRSFYDKTFPLMSTYVFADAIELVELQRLSSNPIRDVPRFTMFTRCGEIPEVADRQLEALRNEEHRLKVVYERELAKTRQRRKFNPGHVVDFAEGAFAGLSGEVVEHKADYALVSITGFQLPVKVSSLLLEKNS